VACHSHAAAAAIASAHDPGDPARSVACLSLGFRLPLRERGEWDARERGHQLEDREAQAVSALAHVRCERHTPLLHRFNRAFGPAFEERRRECALRVALRIETHGIAGHEHRVDSVLPPSAPETAYLFADPARSRCGRAAQDDERIRGL
jgi:hypothetical protein